MFIPLLSTANLLSHAIDEEPLLSTPVTREQLVAHARDLAGLHGDAGPGGGNRLLRWLHQNASMLDGAIEEFSANARAGLRLPPAAVWLVDNRRLITTQITLVRRHLPRSYSRRLPLLQQGSVAGLPRVFVLSRDYIAHADGRLDERTLLEFIAAYQESRVLQLSELWATPIMLRLGLIGNLTRLARRVLTMHRQTIEAGRWADRLLGTAEEHPSDLIIEVGLLARTCMEPATAFVAELRRRLRGHHHVMTVVGGWLDACESDHQGDGDGDDLRHTQLQASDQITAEDTISSLRGLEEIDWGIFVEACSAVEQELRRDPSGIHPLMDRPTRDSYRHAVEELARGSLRNEIDIARHVVALAERSSGDAQHIGHWLIGPGKRQLESGVGLQSTPWRMLGWWYHDHGEIPYVAAVLAGSAAAACAMTDLMGPLASPTWLGALALGLMWLVAFIATSQPVVLFVTWLHGRVVVPRRLARLDLSTGIGDERRTLVVIPSMLKHIGDGPALADALELRFLSNRDPSLRFALLTDFGDAPSAEMPDDEGLLTAACSAVAALNVRHRCDGNKPFLLLHRRRRHNPAEDCWMGWERKRGKLDQLNALLRHRERGDFTVIDGDPAALEGIRYVIALDSDTQLPPGSALKLIEAMAHPLNQPRHGDDGRVISGHALLQPRVSVSTTSAAQSHFSYLSAPDPGIDAYSGVAANLWQDLCGQGSFVGKGIYDLEAFGRALTRRFPDNTILSHDLIEGCYARSALVSDVALVEDQPASLLADQARRHRWMRGDWQIMGWLLPWVRNSVGKLVRNRLGFLARVKIADNLRRALVPPATFVLILVDLTAGSGGYGLAGMLALWLTTPLMASLPALARRGEQVRWRMHVTGVLRRFVRELTGIALSLALLPAEALLALDALCVSWWRLMVSRRRCLEWVTSSEAERLAHSDVLNLYRSLWACPATALGLLAALPGYPAATQAVGCALVALWLMAPWFAWWLSRPQRMVQVALTQADREVIAMTARATWRYFETFVTTEDHWLPPDNAQEQPIVLVAHRTSPTNIGFSLLADLAANDLGYLPTGAMVERCERLLTTMERLERNHGHFYNWYDTRTLAPLPPRYISTVDSGNLAGALVVLAQGMIALERQRADPARVIGGLRDTVSLLIRACAKNPQALSAVGELRGLVEQLPADATADQFAAFSARAGALEGSIQPIGTEAIEWLRALMVQATGWSTFFREVGWDRTPSTTLGSAVDGATGDNARRLVERAHQVAARAEALVEAMDFACLYHRRRRLFAIGMQVDDGKLDRSCYDLLASEARLTSYLAIARSQVPLEHWFALGRPLTEVDGQAALVSWSGSMFEYLMPDLLMPEFPDTLLSLSQRAMLARQIAYAGEHGVPWGISECGYFLTDAAQQWQYRGFGVPGLGLKHGLGDDLVVAPYASALALLVDPVAAVRNLRRLDQEELFGRFGFFEAVDFTPARLPPGASRATVRSWMAHHQGMTLLACTHVLAGATMRARFRADPQLRSMELLLQERAPHQAPFDEAVDETRPLTQAEEAASAQVVTNPNTPQTEATLLSNGRYHVLITATGAGVSSWRGHQLNRWHGDALCESQGLFCYLHDVGRGHRWSTTYQPTLHPSDSHEVVFTQAKAEFRRRDHDIDCTTEIAVASEDDVELRRITLLNRSAVPRTIELTTCAEMVVGSGDADIAHQAFASLAVTTSFHAEQETLLIRRRPRRADEKLPVALHVMTVYEGSPSPVTVETDRTRFIGRGRSLRAPAALDRAGPLGGSIGNMLDSIAALRRRIMLQPGVATIIDVVWGFAADEEAALAVARRYRERTMTDRVAALAWGHARLMLHQLGLTEEVAQAAARLVASLCTLQMARRAAPGVIALNRRSQSALWAHGISGDLPILLLRIASSSDVDVVTDCLAAHAWWRSRGLLVDVVLWNEDPTGYRQDLHERLRTLAEQAQPVDGRPGVVVLRRADQATDDDRIALLSAARVVLDAGHGPFNAQAARRPRPTRPLELLRPPRLPRTRAMAPAPIPKGLTFLNGLGGFAQDGSYVVVLDPSATTPAPWVNLLANPHFGALISASGASCTWGENCHEFRLTPWPHDAATEQSGEALFLRDEEDGGFWSPSQWPAGAPARYVVRHGQGLTTFACQHDDLVSDLATFVAADEPVRVWRWRITNRGERVRRLTATWCGELVMGEQRRREAPFIITTSDPLTGALTARNPHHPDLPRRMVALDSNLRSRFISGDRTSVLGRNRSWDHPEVMQRVTLDGRTGAALDPCLAMQIPFDLAPGQMREIIFVLATGDDGEAATRAARWCAPGAAAAGQAQMEAHWQSLRGGLQISTPDPSLDLLVNHWLPYQTIACRMWARGAWYQSGGAFGFRDQLQDAMALVHLDPAILRKQILLAAAHQFTDGDVQHWWHPPSDRGVRTHCSDDLLWLPSAVARYVDCTGDRTVLDEQVTFLTARQQLPADGDLYEQPLVSQERTSIYDHCLRAIRRASTSGAHGLPLIGSGDWNDGFDRLGHHGRGESVWLAMFLAHVIKSFVPLMHSRSTVVQIHELSLKSDDLLARADEAWDGAWFRRAYDDDGRAVGSVDNTSCRIDSLPQSWAVIAGTPDRGRLRVAMNEVERQLVDPEAGLVKLFTPAIGEADGDPGYIRGYPEGVRENGGQYTHAAVWVALAFARLGDAERAWKVMRLLDPIRRGADPRQLNNRRTEPYVLCGDVYACAPWIGRGGWSWYTGSAGWMYRTLVEELLGIHLEDGHLVINPLLPSDWSGFQATYRRQATSWQLTITSGPNMTTIDGQEVTDHRIPLIEDGQIHQVVAQRNPGTAAK